MGLSYTPWNWMVDFRGVGKGGQGGHVLPEIPMLKKKLGEFLVNALLQLLLAHMSSASGDFAPPHQGSAPGPCWGTSVPSPLVLSPSETNFWLRPWLTLHTSSEVALRCISSRNGVKHQSVSTVTGDNARQCAVNHNV